jgi:hypothetical protein
MQRRNSTDWVIGLCLLLSTINATAASPLAFLRKATLAKEIGKQAAELTPTALRMMALSIDPSSDCADLVSVPLPSMKVPVPEPVQFIVSEEEPDASSTFVPSSQLTKSRLRNWNSFTEGIPQEGRDEKFYARLVVALNLSVQISQHLVNIAEAADKVYRDYSDFNVEEKRSWISHQVYRQANSIPPGAPVHSTLPVDIEALEGKIVSLKRLIQQSQKNRFLVLAGKYLETMETLEITKPAMLTSSPYFIWDLHWDARDPLPMHSPVFLAWASLIESLFEGKN